MTRSVLIIGAQGVLGSVCARSFHERGWHVIRGGRRAEDGDRFRRVDLDEPRTVRDAIAGVDLVLGLVPHPDLVPERLVLQEGGVLVDISARPAAAWTALDGAVPEPRGLVVRNAGRIPGISNLLAAQLLAAHPDADAVEIAFSFSSRGINGPAAGEFLHRHLTATRRRATAVIAFPPPIGPQRCIEIAESDRGWLGDLANDRRVLTCARFSPPMLNGLVLGLNRIGLLSRLPRSAFVKPVEVPEQATSEPVVELLAVRRRGALLASATIEGNGGYQITAAATAVLAEGLLAETSLPSGLTDPQDLLTLDRIHATLEAAGIRIALHPAAGRPRWARPSGGFDLLTR